MKAGQSETFGAEAEAEAEFDLLDEKHLISMIRDLDKEIHELFQVVYKLKELRWSKQKELLELQRTRIEAANARNKVLEVSSPLIKKMMEDTGLGKLEIRKALQLMRKVEA